MKADVFSVWETEKGRILKQRTSSYFIENTNWEYLTPTIRQLVNELNRFSDDDMRYAKTIDTIKDNPLFPNMTITRYYKVIR